MRKITQIFIIALLIIAVPLVIWSTIYLLNSFYFNMKTLEETNFHVTIDDRVYPLYKLNSDLFFLLVSNGSQEEGYYLNIDSKFLSVSPCPESRKTKSGRTKVRKILFSGPKPFELETSFINEGNIIAIKVKGDPYPDYRERRPFLIGKTLNIERLCVEKQLSSSKNVCHEDEFGFNED